MAASSMARRIPHLQLPRGFSDADVDEAARRDAVRVAWRAHSLAYGARPVEAPPVGFASTFSYGHHAADNRCYEFDDKRGRRLALASDSLVAIARLAATRGADESRLSFCCPVFRYVRRPRRFIHHIGMLELVRRRFHTSIEDELAVVRLATAAAAFLREHAVAPLVRLCDPGIWFEMLASAPRDSMSAVTQADPLDKPRVVASAGAPSWAIRIAEVLAQPELDLDAAFTANPPPSIVERLQRLERVRATLATTGVATHIAAANLRATEFQDDLGFEILDPANGRRLSDGGSYNRFGRRFIGEGSSLFSVAMGLETISDYAPPPAPPPIVLVCGPDSQLGPILAITARLRERGVSVWERVGVSNRDAANRYARRCGLRLVVHVDNDMEPLRAWDLERACSVELP